MIASKTNKQQSSYGSAANIIFRRLETKRIHALHLLRFRSVSMRETRQRSPWSYLHQSGNRDGATWYRRSVSFYILLRPSAPRYFLQPGPRSVNKERNDKPLVGILNTWPSEKILRCSLSNEKPVVSNTRSCTLVLLTLVQPNTIRWRTSSNSVCHTSQPCSSTGRTMALYTRPFKDRLMSCQPHRCLRL